jgi:hypothetical protein
VKFRKYEMEHIMGKYSVFEPTSKKKKEIAPIWRGIGCILIIFIPALAYGLMVLAVPLIVESGYAPLELLARVHFPAGVYGLPILSPVASFLGGIDYFWIKLIAFFFILIFLAGMFSLVYTSLYQLFGPARYSKIDAPPSSHKPKVYKR